MNKYNSQFLRFTERFQKNYSPSGYIVDDMKLIRAGPDTKTVDFGDLWDMFRSTDEALLKNHQWVFEDLKDDKFLNANAERTVASMNQKVSYSTFPRSGNSFLRKLLQLVTGLTTGSDMQIELNIDMQLNSNKGEGICDSSVWVYKSHDPMWMPDGLMQKANKVLCCVRNPFDVMASCYTFYNLSGNQGGQMNEALDHYPDLWNECVMKYIENIENYHARMIESISKEAPVFFLRFEDLRTNPQKTLEEVFCFLLEVESVEGLNIQKRITEAVNLGHSATVTYNQKVESVDLNKDSQKKPILFNRNIKRYTPE